MPGAKQGPQEQVVKGQGRREQEYQEDREARLDRQRLGTNHLTPGQHCVALLCPIYSIWLLSAVQI